MAELKRSELGNTASETGAFEKGADPNQINVSEDPGPRPTLDVEAEYVNGDIVIRPTRSPQEFISQFYDDLGRIEEGPIDVLSAQLLEEPDEYGLEIRHVNGVQVEANPGRIREIDKRSPRESLVWYGYSPDGLSAVLGDRVQILKDIMESAYSCKPCRGKGYMEPVCGNCRGGKYEAVQGEKTPCRACVVLGFQMEMRHSSGHRVCDACHGSGWKGGIVVPEQAQQEAVTGIVVSIGPECRLLKLGDRVVHSRYSGHTLKMGEDNALVTMHEKEVLMILRQRNG